MYVYTMGYVIRVAQIIFLVVIKMVAHFIVGILRSQNFQFMKVNIGNINPKTVATIFY